MANESIELYKPYEPAKMQWPAILQRKLDGVPIRLRNISGHYAAWSRQNEVITSVPHIFSHVKNVLGVHGSSITGELHIDGVPFKIISGLVRKKLATEDCKKLVLNVFDADLGASPETPYEARMARAREQWAAYCKSHGFDPLGLPVRFCPGIRVEGADAAEHAFDLLMKACPTAEGAVLHSLSKPFQPGKRAWLTQKMKPRATIDLRVVSFEEAISAKTGEGLKMVGRVNCEFTRMGKDGKPVTDIVGSGPGAMTHSERRLVWARREQYAGKIAEFGYMPDETYDALREPTFIRWRDDKDAPNSERGV